MKKRILSFVLCLALCVSAAPVAARAAGRDVSFEESLAGGVSATEFGTGNASAANYLTFMLRALGYSDANGQDFAWDMPCSLAAGLGLIPLGTSISSFWRADVVRVSYAVLGVKLKGSEQTLAQKLISAGAFSRDDSDPIAEYGQWYPVGGSQICQPDPNTTGGRLEYWFR